MNLKQLLDDYKKYIESLTKIHAIGSSDSMLVQVPFYYSDDDMITFRIAQLNEGWVVTDDCNTWETLSMLGVPVESDDFKNSWKQLTQSAQTIGATDLCELRAFGSAEQIPELLHDLALKAIRSEALIMQHTVTTRTPRYVAEVSSRFARVLESLRDAKRTPYREIEKQIILPSERVVHVAAHCIPEQTKIKPLVVSALNGSSKESRRNAFVSAVSTLSFLNDDYQKVAVLKGAETDWDKGFTRDLESLNTTLHFLPDNQQIDKVAEKLLAA